MGVMRHPYDTLVALRLDAAYRPVGGWEIPREAVEAVYPHGRRTSLTAKLLSQTGVRVIELRRLAAAALAVAEGGVSRR
jgi:hypothetical protein